MFQKAHQHGTIFCRRQEKIRGVIWKKNRRIENRRHASLFKSQKENGKWHSEFVKMLLRNEGSLSIKHWKARL